MAAENDNSGDITVTIPKGILDDLRASSRPPPAGDEMPVTITKVAPLPVFPDED